MERDLTIQIRATRDEKSEIERAKEKAGFASLSEFIRAKMLEFSRKILK
jgi:hypothetical protein